MYSRFVELVAKILVFSFKFLSYVSLSVIRQNGESQNDCVKKTKYSKFSENDDFLPPDTHKYVCISGKKGWFFGKCGVFCFLETPILRFATLPYYRRVQLLTF